MENSITFIPVEPSDAEAVLSLSRFATEIVREHFDPIIGKEQNDYMLSLFQTPEAISRQLQQGYRYYTVHCDGQLAGFTAFYPRGEEMYLSKFYLHRDFRGRHIASAMRDFVKEAAVLEGLHAITLNVSRNNKTVIDIYNHLGFRCIRTEKNDIGSGFYMDDLVLQLKF